MKKAAKDNQLIYTMALCASYLKDQRVVKIIRRGGIGVIPTDTIYGVVGSALKEKTVRRIYRVRRRNPKKPMIVLIDSIHRLKLFLEKIDAKTMKFLRGVWPGKVSVILPCSRRKFAYLHRGTNRLAFRMPANATLRALLKKTGPLVAPSANVEGKQPARTIGEAKQYFGNKVDFYVNAGAFAENPSTLVDIRKGRVRVLRRGAARIKDNMAIVAQKK